MFMLQGLAGQGPEQLTGLCHAPESFKMCVSSPHGEATSLKVKEHETTGVCDQIFQSFLKNKLWSLGGGSI